MTPFPALMTHFPVNIFPNFEPLKVPNNIPRNPPSCCFISCFTASLTPSSNTPEFSSDFMILIISFIFSFEMPKMIYFPTLTTPCPRISLNSTICCSS